MLTDDEVRSIVVDQYGETWCANWLETHDESFWIAQGRAVARAAYNKACEDCAEVFEDFRGNPECKNMFVHAPTVCRNLKHGVGSALRHGENR